MEKFDFKGLAANLLANAREILPSWFPAGRWHGREFVIGSIHGEAGESLSVNSQTGVWKDFSDDSTSGADLISLYAAKEHLSQLEAAQKLSGYSNGANGHVPRGTSAPEEPAVPAPLDAPDPPPHRQHGAPSGLWRYFLAEPGGPVLIQARHEQPDGKKTFSQWTWRGGKWQGKSLPAPRPLYRLRELLASPTLPVLVVEGEKAADAAVGALCGASSHAVVTWAGGSQAWKHTDWSPLAGRRVILWPDADEPGRKCMADIAADLLKRGCDVNIVDIEGWYDGWDAADAVAVNADLSQLIAEAKPIAAEPPVTRMTRAKPARASGKIVDQEGNVEDDGSAFVSWEQLNLQSNANGLPHPTIDNVVKILEFHPHCRGKIWLDTFRHRIYHRLHGPIEAWTDIEASRLLAWITGPLRLHKFGLQLIHHGVELYAANHSRNSVTHWLESLKWDRTERLSDWLADCFGIAKTEFTIAVARNWLISMVARAYQPGCQADHMPVLEGLSGAGKSSALAILGGDWYRAAPQAFGSKEFFEAIQGAWLVEIPDMVGFGRREHAQIISAITTRSDCYRASYARNAEDHPRTTIFAATSETDEYLQDSRGKRRYWPLECTEIRLDVLRANRAQLFAEAVHAFKEGATWHQVPALEAAQEQSRREESDPWLAAITRYIGTRIVVTTSEVASEGLFLEVAKQDRSVQMRISKCLKSLGFVCKVEWVNGRHARLYRR